MFRICADILWLEVLFSRTQGLKADRCVAPRRRGGSISNFVASHNGLTLSSALTAARPVFHRRRMCPLIWLLFCLYLGNGPARPGTARQRAGTARYLTGRGGTSCPAGRALPACVPDLRPRHGTAGRFAYRAGPTGTVKIEGRASP